MKLVGAYAAAAAGRRRWEEQHHHQFAACLSNLHPHRRGSASGVSL